MWSERPSRSKAIPPPSGRDYQFYDVLKKTKNTNCCFETSFEEHLAPLSHSKGFTHVQNVLIYMHVHKIPDEFCSIYRAAFSALVSHFKSIKLRVVLNDMT